MENEPAEEKTEAPKGLAPAYFNDPSSGNLVIITEQGGIPLCRSIGISRMSQNQDGTGWAKILTWKDHNGRDHEWVMPMSMLASGKAKIITKLLDEGLDVPLDSKMRNYIVQYLNDAVPAEGKK